ncbi:MAG: S41 family peptidase [Candidatus Moranbacteria bacterium]|nr:S41 family peptidase [Candidatus Moranbacteria bacterium]
MIDEQAPKTNPEEKNQNIFSKYLSFFIILFLLVGAFGVGYASGKKSADELVLNQTHPIGSTIVTNKFSTGKDSVDFALFWKVWDTLSEKYVNQDSLDAQKLVYGAIRGMLKATDDPYTTFFDPKETKEFAQDIGGSFDGIGAELGIKDDVLTVIAPLDGSPAQKAGLMSGDKIVKIGDKTTQDLTIDSAVDLIRGKKGTEVKLTVFHKGDQETREITIVRDTIEVKSVKVEFKENGIAYLKINQFGEKTAKEFDLAMNQIIAQGSKGIVLDLRNNPGGFLDKSVEIASRFIPKGKIVVIEEDAVGKKDNLYTTGGDKLSTIPLVVLINEGSASASEILAGALRDDRGVQLIGKKSFGKGSVQELIALPNKSSVKVTVAKWMTPNGDYIMEKGITPDTEVELTLEDFKNEKDPQLDKAMEIIKGVVDKTN